MSDPINFIATCEGFVYLGIADDPAAVVAEMRPHCPLPITVASGWRVPPQRRGEVMQRTQAALKAHKVNGQWYKVSLAKAEDVLERQARAADARVWSVRKRPVTEVAAPAGSRPVITPYGEFPSASEAARQLGITKAAVSERAIKRTPGWRYADDDRPQPPPPRRGRPPLKEAAD